MSNDSEISDGFGRKDFHKNDFLSGMRILAKDTHPTTSRFGRDVFRECASNLSDGEGRWQIE
jgi:hypothetical protein